MGSDNRMTAIARILCTLATGVVASFFSGCGGYDVGPPDPLPWNPPALESVQSSGK